MSEVRSIDVPMQIKELGNLNTITDELKQMKKIYDKYCLKKYVSNNKDKDTNIASILKPKKRKRPEDITPITFN